MLSSIRKNQEQMRLKIGKKLETASLNLRFTGSKKEECTSTCSLLKILKPNISEIRKSLIIEPLLLRIERFQLRWFGHVSRMPQERLPKRTSLAKANGRRPVERLRPRWSDYIVDLGWNRLGLHQSEMMEVMEDREVWRFNLEQLPPQPCRKSG